MNSHSCLLAPSILSANFAKLGEEVTDVIQSGADIIHFDVMDNHYVPNLSFGPPVCQSLKKYLINQQIKADIDVHLMVEPVDRLIDAFLEIGVWQISFHPEASRHINRSLQLIKKAGCQAGLVLNPATSFDCLQYSLSFIDYVLIMGVNPGFSGQTFISETLLKIKALRAYLDQQECKSIRIGVDGGINPQNINQIAQAGADTFIVGSALFSQYNSQENFHYQSIIRTLRQNILNLKN